MSKIELLETNSGYNLQKINSNFQKIEDEFNNKVLYRDNPNGEPNEMLDDLDMNGNRIYNLPSPESEHEAARLKDVQDAISGANTARLVSFEPTTDIGATNVQTAIEEVDSHIDKTLRSDLASPSGSSLVGFNQNTTNSITRTVQDKLKDSVSVHDFGAIGDGIADDTEAIQNAIDSGAKRITAVAGRLYRISDTLLVDTNSIVIDFNRATLRLDDPSGTKDFIFLGNGSAQRSAIYIRNITFTREQAASSGYAINSDYIGVSEISGCRIYGNNQIYNGIRLRRAIIINVFNNYIDNCLNYGIYLEGAGLAGQRTIDVSIRENRIIGGVTSLMTHNYVAGFFCRDNIFYNTSGPCVVLSASSPSAGLESFKLQENDFDTSEGVGLFIQYISMVQLTGNWFSENKVRCLEIDDEVKEVIVSGNHIRPHWSAAGAVIRGQDVLFTSNHVHGGQLGLSVSAAALDANISGNTFSNSTSALNITNAPSISVIGNTFHGPGTAISGTGASGTVIRDNKGDTTAGATNHITVGASPFTYTAGSRPEFINIYAGTVSEVKAGTTPIGFTSNVSVLLPPGKSVTVTYSSAPYMVRTFQ